MRPPLPDGSGTMHAEIAREMATRHDWSTSYVNGVAVHASERTLDRCIAASYTIFGVADWSARLPIALCVLALALIAFFFGRVLFVWNAAGLYAALFVLTWPGTFVATRNLTPVPLLCLASALIAFALWYLLAEKKLAGWSGVGVSAMACILMLLIAPWQAAIVPLSISLFSWVAQRRQQQISLAKWPLVAWAVATYLVGYWLEANPYNPLIWLGPVLPVGLLLGGWLADREAFADPVRTRRTAYAVFIIGIIVSAIFILFAIEGPVGFSFFTASPVLTSVAGRIPFIVLAAAVISGVSGNLFHRLHKNARVANCVLAGMLGGFIVALQIGFVVASPEYSSEILADAIRPELEPTDLVVVDGKYPEASSFAFYLQRPILLALPQGIQIPDLIQAPAGTAMVDRIWNEKTRVYLWTRTDHPSPVPGQSYVVASSGGKEILSNQPNSGGASF